MARPPRPAESEPGDVTLVDDEWVPGPDRPAHVEERAPVPPPVRRGPRLWPWLLLLLVLALAGVGAAFYFARDDEESAGPTTEAVSRAPARAAVPDLTGAELNEALDRLQAAGFDADVTQVFARQPSGEVVRQEPEPGTRLEEGSIVQLTVSKGPKPTPVPDVVGQEESEATTVLREAGFEVNVVRVPSQEPEGTVVAQDPAAGETVDAGTPVRLNVAQERATTTTETAPTTGTTPTTAPPPPPPPAPAPTRATVPDVVGLTQAQATRALHDEQLKPQIQFVPSTQVEVGTVVAQAREPGTTLESGGVMQINISVGPERVPLVAVPSVLRLSEAEARTRLQDAGFRVQVLREATDDPAQVGTVVDRQPARSPEGGLVAIWVGRAS